MNFRAVLRFVELLFFVLVMEGNLGVKAAGVVFGASILMARQREYAARFGLKAAGGELCREFRLAEEVLWVIFC